MILCCYSLFWVPHLIPVLKSNTIVIIWDFFGVTAYAINSLFIPKENTREREERENDERMTRETAAVVAVVQILMYSQAHESVVV